MRLKLRAPIVLSFKSPVAHGAVFLLLATVRAALVSYFVFAAFVYPLYNLRWLGSVLIWVARVLYVPIDWFGRLIPPLQSPFSGHGEWGFRSQLLWRHMIVGTLVYIAIFSIPTVVRLVRGRAHRPVEGRA
jgi:hypothetical protein